jgi:hypothetical protein
VSDYYSGGINLSGGQFGAPRDGGRRQHRGQDISHSSKPGTVAVPALHAGVVVSKTVPGPTHGFGYSIVIRSVLDGMEFDFRYAHGPWASQQAIGERIPQGKIILHEGNSGATSGSCVHIEQQRVGGGYLDPLPEIRRVAGGRLTEAAPAPAPAPAPAGGGVTDAGGAVAGVLGPNPFGIPFTGGLQKVANLYLPHGGFGETKLDQNFGPTSMHGFSQFLRAKYGYVGNDVLGPVMWAAIARWLRATKRYSGDDIPGPVMRAALSKADTENWAAL